MFSSLMSRYRLLLVLMVSQVFPYFDELREVCCCCCLFFKITKVLKVFRSTGVL